MAEKALQFLHPDAESGLFSTSLVTRGVPQLALPTKVEMVEVSYQYSGSMQSAVRGVTLEIQAGQQAALIGPSGAGKSTIADLILGLLSPSEGRVLVSGKSPTEIVLRGPGSLAYVPQRPGLISGTVAENIAFGVDKGHVDEVRLKSAIRAAHLDHVIEALPNGINTDLGKRKDELSGGQLQRIGLARALYSNPGLLVMDEATSALDAASENEINKALDELRGKVTVILIAHRLNTVQRSDVVFLVEKGKISGSGSFPELLESNKTVQTLARLMSIAEPKTVGETQS
jgi:ATP-binding cassette subfamily C protein